MNKKKLLLILSSLSLVTLVSSTSIVSCTKDKEKDSNKEQKDFSSLVRVGDMEYIVLDKKSNPRATLNRYYGNSDTIEVPNEIQADNGSGTKKYVVDSIEWSHFYENREGVYGNIRKIKLPSTLKSFEPSNAPTVVAVSDYNGTNYEWNIKPYKFIGLDDNALKFSWEINDDNTVTLTGLNKKEIYQEIINKNEEEEKEIELVIPEKIKFAEKEYTVTKIADSAFQGYIIDYDIVKLELPNTIKEIGYSAFEGHKLTNLYIPSSVQEIKEGAFENYSKEKNLNVTFGNKDTKYYDNSFPKSWYEGYKKPDDNFQQEEKTHENQVGNNKVIYTYYMDDEEKTINIRDIKIESTDKSLSISTLNVPREFSINNILYKVKNISIKQTYDNFSKNKTDENKFIWEINEKDQLLINGVFVEEAENQKIQNINIPSKLNILNKEYQVKGFNYQFHMWRSGDNMPDYKNDQQVKNLSIPGTVEIFSSIAFADQNLKIDNLILEEGIKVITRSAFENVVQKYVEIPSTVKYISSQAFYTKEPIDVKINSKPDFIGQDAFNNKSNINSTTDLNTDYYYSIDNENKEVQILGNWKSDSKIVLNKWYVTKSKNKEDLYDISISYIDIIESKSKYFYNWSILYNAHLSSYAYYNQVELSVEIIDKFIKKYNLSNIESKGFINYGQVENSILLSHYPLWIDTQDMRLFQLI